MRVLTATFATFTLLLSGCSTCNPEPVQAPERAATSADGHPGVQKADAGSALSAPKPTSDASSPTPPKAAESVVTAKQHQPGRKHRVTPKKSLKMAPIQKCPQGGCELRCEAMSRCLFTCDGGDCHQICEPDSSCTATCTGGGCVQQCHPSAGCTLRCAGGQCDQQCDARSACSRTCKGGDCKVCQGTACTIKGL